MAVSQQTPVQTSIASGIGTVFPYTFTVLEASDLVVSGQVGTATPTVYRLGVDYTVSGVGSFAGSVNFLAAPANGTRIIIQRRTAITRAIDYQTNGDLFAATINRDIDRIVLIAQDIDQKVADAATGLPVATAASLSFSPTADIPASNTQTAVVTVDTNARTAAATAAGAVSGLTTRVTALEASAVTGVIGKDTQVNLYADLAWDVGTIAYVTNDATASKNGVYRKLGASGAGSWVQSTMTPGAVDAETVSRVAYSMLSEVPVLGKTVVAMKVASDRWVIRTPVSGGEPHDYTEFVMFNMGAYQAGGGAIAYAWSLNSVRAMIGGVLHKYMEQDPLGPSVGTNEFAMYIGTEAGNLTPVNVGGTYDFYGFGHGWMDYTSLAITLDGGGTNYRDLAPVGTILRGNSLVFDASFAPKTAAGTTIGTCGVAHIFDASGLLVSQQHVISTAGIFAQNSYSAMFNSSGVDRVKGKGADPIEVHALDGSQSISLGKVDTFAFYMSARPNNLMELILPYGGPVSGGSWAGATTSDTFVVNNTNGVSKFYVNWRSGASPAAYFGTYNFLTRYRVRVGAAL